MWRYVAVLVVCLVREARGYSVGAPTRQCDRMYPGHGLAAQVGPSPYSIQLSQNTFGCSNDEITVTLTGMTPFKGFLCQPRPNPEVYQVSGVLASDGTDNVPKQDVCGEGRSLTHASNSNKTKIEFKWRPTTADNVYIVCTVVNSYRTFWVKQRSQVITFVRKNCVRTTPPSSSTSTPSSQTVSPPTSDSTTPSRHTHTSTSHTPTVTRQQPPSRDDVTTGSRQSDTTTPNNSDNICAVQLFHFVTACVAILLVYI